jgi:hypothetical protein
MNTFCNLIKEVWIFKMKRGSETFEIDVTGDDSIEILKVKVKEKLGLNSKKTYIYVFTNFVLIIMCNLPKKNMGL